MWGGKEERRGEKKNKAKKKKKRRAKHKRALSLSLSLLLLLLLFDSKRINTLKSVPENVRCSRHHSSFIFFSLSRKPNKTTRERGRPVIAKGEGGKKKPQTRSLRLFHCALILLNWIGLDWIGLDWVRSGRFFCVCLWICLHFFGTITCKQASKKKKHCFFSSSLFIQVTAS